MNNKWMRAAVPALLIHCSVGTVYCWSTFKEAIADKIGMSPFSVNTGKFCLSLLLARLFCGFCGFPCC